MKRVASPARSLMWLAWPMVALVVVTATLPAMAAERTVLGEYFNALW